MSRYREVEFVCYNSDYKYSTDKRDQKKLFKELKILSREGYGIIPYMQNFSDDNHEEISLAVVITDNAKRVALEEIIKNLADRIGVNIDLVSYRNDREVDGIVRGDLYDNMMV